MRNLGMALLVGVLLAMLAASIWYAYGLWTAVETADLPVELYVAMAGGVLFSIVVGGGLMALLFYSHRHGYDDAASGERRD
jgi:hypothetical protein